MGYDAAILCLDAVHSLANGRDVVKEKALLRHRQKPGHRKSHRNTRKRDDIQTEQGPACHGDEDLPQDRAHSKAHQGGTPTVTCDFLVHVQVHHAVDIRVIGNFSGCGDAIEEFQELNGQQSLGVEQHEPRNDKAESLKQDDKLVTEVVCGKEHRKQQHQVRVSPYWINFIEDLTEKDNEKPISDINGPGIFVTIYSYKTTYQYLS